MSKTVTIKLDDEIFEAIKSIAISEDKSIPALFEHAMLKYLFHTYVDDAEMDEILSDEELKKSLREGLKEIKDGKYKIVS